jgi:type I restriction enzyme S subunit
MKEDKLVKNWEYKKLGEVCKKLSLNNIKIKQKDYQNEGNYPVIDQGQELIGGYCNNKELLIPNEPPYIIFGDHTKVKKFINFKFIAGGDGLKVLKPDSIFNPKFFFYLIHTVKIPNKGYARHFQFLEKEIIPIPPLPEQQAIVSKIEELLSELENGKQQLLIAKQQLKVYRQSLLKAAFEGKLTNQNVKEGELPKGWKWVRFGEIFNGTPQNGLYKPSTEYGSGTPILRIDGFYDGVVVQDYEYKRVRISDEELLKYQLSINDIVVNRVNSMSHLGKCGLINSLKEPTVFESNVMRIQIKTEVALPRYISNYLSSLKGLKELTKNAKHAVNQASINQTDVSNVSIPIAPFSEQQLIVSELESKLTVCNKIEETISQSLLQAETLRQSILKKAFEGKLLTSNESENTL